MSALVAIVIICASGSAGAQTQATHSTEMQNKTKDTSTASNFHVSVAFASDYVFRGISQTLESPAIQGSMDYLHSHSWYLGIWGSNVDETISEGNSEIDFYGGYKIGVMDNLFFTPSLIYYWYPRAGYPKADYIEGQANLNIVITDIVTTPDVYTTYNFSSNFFGEDGIGHHIKSGITLLMPLGLNIGAEIAYQTVEGGKTTGSGKGKNGENGYDYSYWRIGVTYPLGGFLLNLLYYSTSESEYFGTIGDERFVFLISRSS